MSNFPEHFEQQYQLHLKHLKLEGRRPKTIDAYARGALRCPPARWPRRHGRLGVARGQLLRVVCRRMPAMATENPPKPQPVHVTLPDKPDPAQAHPMN